MYGINSPGDLETALLQRPGKIVGLLFCPYQKHGDTLNATWFHDYHQWSVYSSSDLDILATGYSNYGVEPISDADARIVLRDDVVKVGETLTSIPLWFSTDGMYECVDFVSKKTARKWQPSGGFDLLFLKHWELLGIDWQRLAAIDVGMLVRDGIYPDANGFMHKVIAKFKDDRRPYTDVDKLYWDLKTIPTIKEHAGKVALELSKMVIEAAFKLIVPHGAAAH
jgi:hypothetical protein